MDTPSTTTPQDKQITVDVPADRVPEFYAFYARFLAGRPRPGRRGRGHRGGPQGHRCGHPHHDRHGADARDARPRPAQA
ncbi:hypothetical protein [Paraconexibacter algicola]|uniref:Uncharacterized protein n=1 Tax=Paraconexibacter algicola TaxID=2133960 RepID=A0A2T4UFY7_9ACTN|nr:hypothetical protein [Paraconexibacter algicola]PTL58162.1 hypothetical protein C7Y72_00100 [Paraconexibacter algicola]